MVSCGGTATRRLGACTPQQLSGLAIGRPQVQRRHQLVFALLILVQAAHSVEEYTTGLYEVFPPARYISGLVSDDLAVGFAIVNATLVAFGIWCYLVPIRSGRSSSRGWAWPWVLLELGNSIAHGIMAFSAGGYFPGALTAAPLFVVAAWLGHLLVKREPIPGAAAGS